MSNVNLQSDNEALPELKRVQWNTSQNIHMPTSNFPLCTELYCPMQLVVVSEHKSVDGFNVTLKW